MGLNKVILIGRLTRDVDVKLYNDTKLTSFTIAVDRKYKSKDENQPTVDFIPIRAWRKSAEFAETYFRKGKQVYVSGSLETYTYEHDGRKVYAFHVETDEVGFADTVRTDQAEKAKPIHSVPAEIYIRQLEVQIHLYSHRLKKRFHFQI